MKRFVSLLFFFFTISFGFFLFFVTPHAQAYLWCEGNQCGGYTRYGSGCNTQLVPPSDQICDSNADNQYCGMGDYCPYKYCGWTSSACCTGASYWTKYWQQCDTFYKTVNGVVQYSCQTAIYPTGQTCSMGDKCATTPTSIIQPGQCDCSVGPFNYKTCCDSNGNQVNAVCSPTNDGTGNVDGNCPSGSQTIYCNDPKYNNRPSSPTCGQPACDSIAPPQTVQGNIKDDHGNNLSGISVVITNTTKNTSTTVTTDGNGNFSDSSQVRRGNSFTVSPNKSAGSAPCNNGMICGNSWSPNSPNPYTASNSSGCSNNSNTWTCNFSYTQGYINGTVYIDYNHNGVVDAEDDTAPAGITIKDSSGTTTTTAANGTYTLPKLNQGSHTITITIPNGYAAVNGDTTNVVTIGPNVTNSNFMITPLYTISGEICDDPGIDGSCLDAEDTSLPNASSVTITPVTTDGTAKQSRTQAQYLAGAQVVSGTYTVTYSAANGYYFTASKVPNKTLPPFKVSVGQSTKIDGSGNKYSCVAPAAGTTDASCSGANIVNLNFALSNKEPWQQGFCTDLRMESTGLDDHLPNNGSCTDPTSGVSIPNSYAIVCMGNNSGVGVYYAGQNSPSFGYNGGKASQPNYVVGSPYSESFTPVSGVNRASYEYLLDTANSSGITPVDLSGTDPNTGLPYCSGGLNNCDFEPNLPDGVYIVPSTVNSGNLTLNLSGQVPDPGNNKSYVFLVSGKLTIKSKVLVSKSSSTIFAAKGDISVAANVGEPIASYGSTSPDIQGFYTTDGDFWILSNSTTSVCGVGGAPLDLRLNIDGGVVIGGKLQNQRDLCKYDASCPVTTYSTDYSYLLNTPNFIKHKNQLWQETAPNGQ